MLSSPNFYAIMNKVVFAGSYINSVVQEL